MQRSFCLGRSMELKLKLGTKEDAVTSAEQIKQNIVKAVKEVRVTNPMAGSVTNTVTIDFVANAQLAVGGSAAMVYLPDEGECLVAAGGAVYLNTGTQFPLYTETIPRTAAAAFSSGKPWVIDPVGIGIGQQRSDLLLEVKRYKPTIIRGNASEIIALAGLWDLEGTTKDLSRARGVDTTDTVSEARDAAIALARFTGGAVAVSGETDLVTDGKTLVFSQGGSSLMSKVTGFGCSQGGVLAGQLLGSHLGGGGILQIVFDLAAHIIRAAAGLFQLIAVVQRGHDGSGGDGNRIGRAHQLIHIKIQALGQILHVIFTFVGRDHIARTADGQTYFVSHSWGLLCFS